MKSSDIRNLALVSAILALGVSAHGHARGNAEAGKEKAAICFSCHGEDGVGIDSTYPKLAGQYEDYLVKSLEQYKTGKRNNAIMAGMVTALSAEDMEDISAYYASKKALIDLKID